MAELRRYDSTNSRIAVTDFGTTHDGTAVQKFTFANNNGYEVEMLNYGATVVAVKTPDRAGELTNIALGCESIANYEANDALLGATVGRFCNRIGGAKFTIDSQQFDLTANDGDHTLHGGKLGFKQKVWDAELIQRPDALGVRFTTISPDGEEGFPGTVDVTVEYLLNEDNELTIEFFAATDKPTHVNLTNHCYWNLADAGQTAIYDHQLQINADRFVEVDAEGIPSGKLSAVASTPLDFRLPKRVGADLQQLKNTPQGYDHCFVLNDELHKSGLKFAAVVSLPLTGRRIEIFTDQPGLQFYSSNYMDGEPSSGSFQVHTGIALETQHYPDAPNHDHFPSTLLRPGADFRSKTVFRFSVEK